MARYRHSLVYRVRVVSIVVGLAAAAVMAAVLLACVNSGCSAASKGCAAIHVADNACHVLVLVDGTVVPVSSGDLEGFARTAATRIKDGGADGNR